MGNEVHRDFKGEAYQPQEDDVYVCFWMIWSIEIIFAEWFIHSSMMAAK